MSKNRKYILDGSPRKGYILVAKSNEPSSMMSYNWVKLPSTIQKYSIIRSLIKRIRK